MIVLKEGRNFKNINTEQSTEYMTCSSFLSALRRYTDGMGTWSNKANGMIEDHKYLKASRKYRF